MPELTPAQLYRQRLLARQEAETSAVTEKPIDEAAVHIGAAHVARLRETHVIVGDHTPERRRA